MEKAFLSQSLVALALLPLLVWVLIQILFHALLPVHELVSVAMIAPTGVMPLQRLEGWEERQLQVGLEHGRWSEECCTRHDKPSPAWSLPLKTRLSSKIFF